MNIAILIKKIVKYKEKPLNKDINIDCIGGGNPIVNVGMHTYINSAKLYCWKPGYKLLIGNYCSLAENISFILGGEHDINWASTYPFIERWGIDSLKNKITMKCKGDINIESDVWIGHGVTILSGSKIGVGSVIGAGAVVRGAIPPYSIAVGVPAKVIKKRFSDDVCDELINSKWWTLKKENLISIIKYIDDPIMFIKAIKTIDEKN